MTISASSTRNVVTLGAGATSTTFQFDYLNVANIMVAFDNVLKTAGVDYNISNKTVTFTNPLAQQTVVAIISNEPYGRTYDLIQAEEWDATVINNNFNKLALQLTQLRDKSVLVDTFSPITNAAKLIEDATASALSYATISQQYAQESKDWAIKETIVDNGYSSKSWATKLGSTVDGTYYSSQQYALNAKDWAEKETEVLPGQYSAKYWAGQAAGIVLADIVDNGLTGEVTIGFRIAGSTQRMGTNSTNAGWSSGVSTLNNKSNLYLSYNNDAAYSQFYNYLNTLNGSLYSNSLQRAQATDGSYAEQWIGYALNGSIVAPIKRGLMQFTSNSKTWTSTNDCYIDASGYPINQNLVGNGTDICGIGWGNYDVANNRFHLPFLPGNLAAQTHNLNSLMYFGAVRVKTYNNGSIYLALNAVFNGSTWGCSLGGYMPLTFTNQVDPFTTFSVGSIGASGVLLNTLFGTVNIAGGSPTGNTAPVRGFMLQSGDNIHVGLGFGISTTGSLAICFNAVFQCGAITL